MLGHLLLTAALAAAPAPEILLKEKIDLNGDAKADKILIVAAIGQGDLKAVKITVGSVSLADIQMYKSVAVSIVDVNTGDPAKQIRVDGTSESGKKWFTFFVYDGRKIVQALKVDTKHESGALTLLGGGQVLIDRPLGFYVEHTTWTLRGSTFEESEQPYLYVGKEATVSQPVQLMHDANSGSPVTGLAAGDAVEILVVTTDDRPWYLVRTIQTGLVGWVEGSEVGPGKSIAPGSPAVAAE